MASRAFGNSEVIKETQHLVFLQKFAALAPQTRVGQGDFNGFGSRQHLRGKDMELEVQLRVK